MTFGFLPSWPRTETLTRCMANADATDGSNPFASAAGSVSGGVYSGPDRLIPPAMQQAKQPFWARLQLLARRTLNAGKHAGNQPARLAQLDDGYDRAILVQSDEGPALLRTLPPECVQEA
jgi:hypothetical protein